MCLAIPGRIKSVNRTWAEVDVMGVLNTVNIQLIDSPEADDYILIHAGCAIQKISAEHSSFLQSVLAEFMIEDEKDG
jgi:hydrogenase assembly chaperone HypC/HupF